MVRNNFMMHLYTFATLCFFKITLPRNYYYCNQDDTIPWVCVLKYVSNSNCCHRHLKVYISMFKSFHTYRKYIYQQSVPSAQLPVVYFLWFTSVIDVISKENIRACRSHDDIYSLFYRSLWNKTHLYHIFPRTFLPNSLDETTEGWNTQL